MILTSATSPAGSQAAAASTETPRLATAAKQFESVLLGQWLQEAESSFASVPGGEEDTDTGGQQMQGFATQQLATSLTASGGIGIARLVQGALAHASEREQTGAGAMEPAAFVDRAIAKAGNSASAMAAYREEARR